MSMCIEGHDSIHEAWCRWLLTLSPSSWLAIKADELFYYDAFRSHNMSASEILRHARENSSVEHYSFHV